MAESQPLFLVAGVKRLGWDLLLLLLVELLVHSLVEPLLLPLLDVGLLLEVLLTLLDIDYLLLDFIVGGGPVLLEEYLPTLKDSYESEIKSRLNLACLE